MATSLKCDLPDCCDRKILNPLGFIRVEQNQGPPKTYPQARTPATGDGKGRFWVCNRGAVNALTVARQAGLDLGFLTFQDIKAEALITAWGSGVGGTTFGAFPKKVTCGVCGLTKTLKVNNGVGVTFYNLPAGDEATLFVFCEKCRRAVEKALSRLETRAKIFALATTFRHLGIRPEETEPEIEAEPVPEVIASGPRYDGGATIGARTSLLQAVRSSEAA